MIAFDDDELTEQVDDAQGRELSQGDVENQTDTNEVDPRDPNQGFGEEEICMAAGKGFSVSHILPFKTKKETKKEAKALSQTQAKTGGSFGVYGVKSNSNPEYGNSVCFIIANFTGDLEGYNVDIQEIADLHENTLMCGQVFKDEFCWANQSYPMKNLTKCRFMRLLGAIQSYLKVAEDIDRFFLYILSHGDEHGIKMCKEGDDFFEEQDESGTPIRVQMIDIVNMFTHDQVLSLKSFPKVIINQSCQGDEILQAAGNQKCKPDLVCNAWKPPPAKIAIGADVIVCDASSNKTKAWVSKGGGSIFIQELMQVIQDHHKEEHFYDLLVEANDRVSVRRGKGEAANKAIVATYQMPCIHSRLTKKFYLAIPLLKKK